MAAMGMFLAQAALKVALPMRPNPLMAMRGIEYFCFDGLKLKLRKQPFSLGNRESYKFSNDNVFSDHMNGLCDMILHRNFFVKKKSLLEQTNVLVILFEFSGNDFFDNGIRFFFGFHLFAIDFFLFFDNIRRDIGWFHK